MFRKRIILDEKSDAAATLAQTDADCRAAGLSCQDAQIIISQVRDPLNALIQGGNAVASSGGQFRANREIETDGAVISLIARYGLPRGLFARLWKGLSRGR
jgi:hypothetical protein